MLKLTSVARKPVTGDASLAERVNGTRSNKLEVSAWRLLKLLRNSEISRVPGKPAAGRLFKKEVLAL